MVRTVVVVVVVSVALLAFDHLGNEGKRSEQRQNKTDILFLGKGFEDCYCDFFTSQYRLSLTRPQCTYHTISYHAIYLDIITAI